MVYNAPTTHRVRDQVSKNIGANLDPSHVLWMGGDPIQMAKDLSIEVHEKDLRYEDLKNADEAFFTGTAVEITPITIVDNKPVNNGKRGNITIELQDKFQQIISGEDSSYESWPTYTN